MSHPSTKIRRRAEQAGIAMPLPHRARTGAVAVEFAIVSSILFILVFGLIEFTRIGAIRHSVDNASYEAARHVIVPGATAEEAKDIAREFLGKLAITNPTIIISPDPIGEGTSEVTVDISVPLQGNTWGISNFSSGMVLSSQTTLITERPPIVLAQALAKKTAPPTPQPTPNPPGTNPNPKPGPTPSPAPTPTPPPSSRPPSPPSPPSPPAPPKPPTPRR